MKSTLSINRGISVVICCYNSAWVIRRTLEALKKQRFNTPIPYEVVLVDNRCTDDTVAVAEDTMKDSKIDFRIVREDNPGLANARRKGIKEVKYEYVIYCDDDNIFCFDYVSTMAELLEMMPDVGAIGGKGIAEFESEPAEIVKNHLECYAVGSQLEHKDWLFGAGVALRTALVRDVYDNQKCYLIGRKGGVLLSGDDSELVMSMVLRGYKVFALDDVWYTHVLKSERLTEDYFHRLYEGLILPLPAFEVMRGVIYNKSFFGAMKVYRYWYRRYIKYNILRWKPNASKKAKEASSNLKPLHYWSVIKLYTIYRQWSGIKKRNRFKTTIQTAPPKKNHYHQSQQP